MKKYAITLAWMLALLASCSTDNEATEEKPANPTAALKVNTDTMETHAVITFNFNPPATATTRASLAELQMTDLWIFDYMAGTLKQTIHETADLASATLAIDYGEHDFYFVASRGTNPTVEAPAISWEKPNDTFWGSLSLDVQPSGQATQNVALARVATRLRIVPSDEIPANATQLSVTPAHWYYGIDIKTGTGVDDRTQERTISIPASYVGTSGTLSASFFGLSQSEEWTTDVTVKMMDAESATLGSISAQNVAFKQNRVSVYSGGVLNAGKLFNFTADDAWLEDNVQTW